MWNKVLEPRKMEQASTYLMAKLAAGVQEEPRRADSCHCGHKSALGESGNRWESMGIDGNRWEWLVSVILNSACNWLSFFGEPAFGNQPPFQEFKISKPDGNCNGRRVQVQLQTPLEGWRHNAEGGDPTDPGSAKRFICNLCSGNELQIAGFWSIALVLFAWQCHLWQVLQVAKQKKP